MTHDRESMPPRQVLLGWGRGSPDAIAEKSSMTNRMVILRDMVGSRLSLRGKRKHEVRLSPSPGRELDSGPD